MKFVVSASNLSSHLQTIGRVIVPKNNILILDCFCFDIKDGKLTITASDNDTVLTTTLELNESEADVRFAINAKTIQDIIKEIPDQPLEFYLNTDTLEMTIVYQNGQYKLMTQDATDYPIPVFSEENVIPVTVDAAVLFAGVSRSIVAAANDMMRPQLSSVCFDVREGSVTLVATNAQHMALTQVPLGETPNEGIFMLPTRPAGMLRGILAKEEGDVLIKFGQRSVHFSTPQYTMSCLLVDGRYPNYRSAFPKNTPNNLVTVNRAALISVLRRVLVCANPGAVLVKIQLEASQLKISSQDVEFGKSADETMLCDYSGVPMRVAFKGSTLLDLVQNIEADEVTIKLTDSHSAGLIEPSVQNEAQNVVMLIMPSIFND